ncbi:hypothetical protein VPH35_021082 [Triticum aestivum]
MQGVWLSVATRAARSGLHQTNQAIEPNKLTFQLYSCTRDLGVALAVLPLLFMPGASAVVPSIDATRTRHLPLPPGLLRGPESVAFDAKGNGPYSGISDGRVLKWNGDRLGWTTSEACTASSGYLYIADAYKGLRRVAPGGGEATVLVTEADGAPLRFTNGVDVDQVTGEVYFTDSSMKYQRYDPRTGKVIVLKAGITYPNGLAISADRTHLVISSTGPCKLLRYWTKGGPKTGTMELLTDLPGYPDNLRPDKKGGYWVALHHRYLLALRIGADGKIIEEMRGPKAKGMRPAEVVEWTRGRLFVGSVELSYVAMATRK